MFRVIDEDDVNYIALNEEDGQTTYFNKEITRKNNLFLQSVFNENERYIYSTGVEYYNMQGISPCVSK